MRWWWCSLAFAGCFSGFPDYEFGYYNGPWDRDGAPPDYSHHDGGPDDGGSSDSSARPSDAGMAARDASGAEAGTHELDAASAGQCDARAYSPTKTYAVGDEVAATCTAEAVGTVCYGHLGQRFRFRCVADGCASRAPGGDENGWWSAWDSLGPC